MSGSMVGLFQIQRAVGKLLSQKACKENINTLIAEHRREYWELYQKLGGTAFEQNFADWNNYIDTLVELAKSWNVYDEKIATPSLATV